MNVRLEKTRIPPHLLRYFETDTCSSCYVCHTVEILREVWRVLRKDGVVFFNLGDSYASQAGGYSDNGSRGSTSQISAKTQAAVVSNKRRPVPLGLKPKDLCGIPARVALAAQADGWYWRQDIIWQKENPMPQSVTDRPTTSHEHILLLTKSGKACYWTHRDGAGTRRRPKADWRWIHRVTREEVDQKPEGWKTLEVCPGCEGTGRISVHLGLDIWQDDDCPGCEGEGKVEMWKRINLWLGHDYYWDQEAVREPHTESTINRIEYGLKHRHPDNIGVGIPPVDTDRMGERFASPGGRNIRSVWTFPTQPYPDAHFAVFPEKLPEACIKAATPEVGCCEKCGAPWVRVTEHTVGVSKDCPKTQSAHEARGGTGKPVGTVGQSGSGRTDAVTKTTGWQPTCECGDHDAETGSAYASGSNANRIAKLRQAARAKGGEYVNTKHTTGHQPTCSCAADKVPSIVLDPFAGSGTTMWVAKKMGRRAVGYELSEEYCRLILDRNRQAAMELMV